MLFNLLGNAVKFTFAGAVTLRVDFVRETLQVQVEDTGIGIQREDLSKLFQFFGKISKTKDINKGGMGLGLTISKMILQQLGGEIRVSSVFGKGSIFAFALPVDGHEMGVVPSSNQQDPDDELDSCEATFSEDGD